jgi:subtilisin family serine protease
MVVESEIAPDSPIEAIEPERFTFAQQITGQFTRSVAPSVDGGVSEYLRGFVHAAEVIAQDLYNARQRGVFEDEEQALVLGVTWGLLTCRVPQSVQTGAGIKVAVLDTGMDLGNPHFAGRQIVSQTFVGQPVQDLFGHGTHCIGTACGPQAPAGDVPRYGIAFRSSVFVGKVLSNSGSGSTGTVLAGLNWAIANRCEVISMSLGSSAPVQAAYTAAGQAALNNGLLIVAAAGNVPGGATGSPANSPTIMSVAALDQNLAPSSFSSSGKVEIAAPGRDVLSLLPRPQRYGTKSGTSMATPHVAGCAALWAQTSPTLRGMSLWRKLQASAKPLPYPASRVGAGLVQAP